jgi:benzoyl-CoA reductase/2-hydroxyglutaryl-CoA dehydratase subunit BcrC/BadD/HgdB
MKEEKENPKKFQTISLMKEIMRDYFLEMDEAAKTGSKKIAWCTSVGPAELLRAMGFLVYFPETHSAMLGATRMATDLIPRANAIGYSPEICSYLTADIGAHLAGVSPLKTVYGDIEGPPRPDILVFNTNQCRDVKDWFSWYGRELHRPVVGVYTHRNIGEIKDFELKDIATQIEDLIPSLEAVSGTKFDLDLFKHSVALSRECSELWEKCLQTAAHLPSPWTFFDHTIHMAPAVVLRGTQTAVDYYKSLLEELKQKLNQGISAVDNEKFRLYWEGMPIWGKLRSMSETFQSLQSCLVASTYCNSWVYKQLDENDPFMSMARAYTELFIVRDEDYKVSYIEKMCDLYKVDGLLFHDAKTCPNNSNNRYSMPERLTKKLGIPTLTINGDLNDLRLFSEQQSITNIEAFAEQLSEMH